MATKKGNGHDPLTVEMVSILRTISEDIREMRGDIREMRGDIRATNQRLDAFQIQAHDDQVKLRAELNLRLDSMQEDIRETLGPGTTGASLAERVGRLEAAVFKPAAE